MRGGENGGGHDGPANFGRRRRRSAREGEKSVESDGEGGRVLVRGKEVRFRAEERQGRECRRRRAGGRRSREAEERREDRMREGRRRREFGNEEGMEGDECLYIYFRENYH